jgi:bla regulator protein BlaR1
MNLLVRLTILTDLFQRARWKRAAGCACLLAASFLSVPAQTADPAAPKEAVPAWQRALGDKKLAFEFASIRPSEPDTFAPPNFPLSPDDFYTSTGGRFVADFPLTVYIEFAYKLSLAPGQRKAMIASLPKWVASQSFTIHAQADGNPSKDQMRLMVQSLLADRFGLRVHFELQMTPALTLTLSKAGKIGPQLRPHAEGPPCEAANKDLGMSESAGGRTPFPPQCHIFMGHPGETGQLEFGSRDVSPALLASMLPSMEDQGFAIVDQTGLPGTYDFRLHFVPQRKLTPGAGHEGAVAPEGPEFPTALNEQLGLKLKRVTLPINTIVIDHVEEPSPN